MSDHDLIDAALLAAKNITNDLGAKSLGKTIEAAIAANDITESIYWQMLMDLESHMRSDDTLGKLLVEGAYKHWNRLHPDNTPMSPRWNK
jgi:hypothetical protein